MPPSKKRKAGTSVGTAASKKVRIGEETVMGEPDTTTQTSAPTTALAGRPKRATAGEPPRYIFTRPKLTAAQKAGNDKSDVAEPAKQGRGRPRKGGKNELKEERVAEKAPLNAPVKVSPSKASLGKKPVGRPRKSAAKRFTRVKSHGVQQSARSAVRKSEKEDTSSSTVKSKTKTEAKTKTKASTKSATKAGNTSKPGPGRPRKDSTIVVLVETPETELATDNEITEDEDEDNEYPDRQYFLMKAEPESRIEKGHDVRFSIDDLEAADEPEAWDGVRNFSARNVMRVMRKGDLAFFYHSNCKEPGVVGVMRIVQEHSVDRSAFNPAHPYYDEKSDPENPRWDVVHVEFVRKFDRIVNLKELRSFSEKGGALADLQTLRQARLSVSAVKPKEWRFILKLAGEEDLEVFLEEAEIEREDDVDEEETEVDNEAGANGLDDVGGELKQWIGKSNGSYDGATEEGDFEGDEDA